MTTQNSYKITATLTAYNKCYVSYVEISGSIDDAIEGYNKNFKGRRRGNSLYGFAQGELVRVDFEQA